MTAEGANLNTSQKALELNLDRLVYGSIAEIGAGQEVARHFFQAGGASGTVAKTVSAYDMQVSDTIYGADESGRYVTRFRLESMLETEYSLVIKMVAPTRAPESTFFAFADTVAARSHKSEHDCHGWMGIRFQHAPGAESSQIVLHVRMLDTSNRGQQDALGILGVNLIHAAFNHSEDPEKLVESLKDDIAWGRVEVDYIDFGGPGFENIDNLKMNLGLVVSSLGPVAMFTPEGKAALPADLFHKKHVLILRGAFRPFTDVQADMIRRGIVAFCEDLGTSERNIVCYCEMNVARYLSEGLDEISDLEERVERLTGLGYNVMVTSHYRYFRLGEYFSKHEKRCIGYILSVADISSIFDEKYYDGMEGGILEAMGKLFASDSKLLVYPNLTPDGKIVTARNAVIPDTQKHLYSHLLHNGRIIPLEPVRESLVPFDR